MKEIGSEKLVQDLWLIIAFLGMLSFELVVFDSRVGVRQAGFWYIALCKLYVSYRKEYVVYCA